MHLKRLWLFRRYFAPHKVHLSFLAFLMLVTTLTEGLGVGLLYPLLEFVQLGGDYAAHGASAKPVALVLGFLGLQTTFGSFMGVIFFVVASALALRHALWVLSASIFNPLAQKLRDEAFDSILHSHLSHFYSSSSGALINSIEGEADYVAQAFSLLVLSATHAVSVVVYTALILFVSWKLTAVVVALGALRYLASGIFIRRINVAGEENRLQRLALKSHLIGVHQGIDVIKSSGAEDRELRRFVALSGRMRENSFEISRVNAESALAEGLLGDILLCAVIFLAISAFHLPAAALLSFLFVNTRIVPKITAINAGRIQIAEYLSKVVELPKILFGAGLPKIRWGTREKAALKDRVVFENVGFSYPEADRPSLQGISLEIPRGATIALVGESGSGKSTLARLLLRLFDPSSGRILVDGIPLPELRGEDWTRLVSVVGQDAYIFDDTLENNVKYGVDSCTDAQFREALRRAKADDFVAAMPEREKTPLGERGVKLSGGQRQRIAIARAFLRDSPLLILDEATSAMDAVTESQIQDALAELAKDRTLLVIAHRFTTIRGADRIAVLEHGRVAETGTHAELLGRGGLYRRYHDLQVC